MPKKNRKTVEAFSLFAFQDIITSVTGIVLFITLLLAVELMERTENTPESQTVEQTKDIQETIRQLQKEKTELSKKLSATAADLSSLPSTDLSTLQKMNADLAAESDALKKSVESTQKKLSKKKKQLQKLDSETKQKIVDQKKQLEQLNKENLIAEQKVKDVKDDKRLFFRSGVKDKTTWLVEVTGSGYSMAKLGVSQIPKTAQSQSSFGSWLSGLSNRNEAVYMLVKPGGRVNARAAKELLKSKGIDYGFGLIGANQVLIDPNSGAGAN